MDTLETRSITIGKATLEIKHVADYDADFSYLGEYSNYRAPKTASQKLIHRNTGAILDHHGIWRDERGRLVSAPAELRGTREYEYTFHDNGHDRLKHAYADHLRMKGLERGDWYYLGVVVTLTLDGVDIGEDSLWGIESDSGREYIAEVEHDCARQALVAARQWRARNLVTC